MAVEEIAVSADGLARVFYDDDDRIVADVSAIAPSGERLTRRVLLGRRPGSGVAPMVEVYAPDGTRRSDLDFPADAAPAVRAAALRAAAVSVAKVRTSPAPITAERRLELEQAREAAVRREREEQARLDALAKVYDPNRLPPLPPVDEHVHGTLAHEPTRRELEEEIGERVDEVRSSLEVLKGGDDRRRTYLTPTMPNFWTAKGPAPWEA